MPTIISDYYTMVNLYTIRPNCYQERWHQNDKDKEEIMIQIWMC